VTSQYLIENARVIDQWWKRQSLSENFPKEEKAITSQRRFVRDDRPATRPKAWTSTSSINNKSNVAAPQTAAPKILFGGRLRLASTRRALTDIQRAVVTPLHEVPRVALGTLVL